MQAERAEIVEWRLSLRDPWKRRISLALGGKHGLEPQSDHRQGSRTVMVRATKVQIGFEFWPEFDQFAAQLGRFLDHVTPRALQEALRQGAREEAIRPERP